MQKREPLTEYNYLFEKCGSGCYSKGTCDGTKIIRTQEVLAPSEHNSSQLYSLKIFLCCFFLEHLEQEAPVNLPLPWWQTGFLTMRECQLIVWIIKSYRIYLFSWQKESDERLLLIESES